MSVSPPGRPLFILFPASPHPPLPGDLLLITTQSGTPRRQHLGFLLAGPLQRWCQLHQAGRKAQQVFRAAGPTAQVGINQLGGSGSHSLILMLYYRGQQPLALVSQLARRSMITGTFFGALFLHLF